MKKYAFVLIAFVFIAIVKPAYAQKAAAEFTGAVPKLAHYDALYTLNSGDDMKIKTIFRSVHHALEDPRLKGKLKVEVIVFSDGIAAFMKNSPYEAQWKELLDMGVILAQCNNTMIARNVKKEDLFPFVSIVPSGNGEIILRQYEGWAVVNL